MFVIDTHKQANNTNLSTGRCYAGVCCGDKYKDVITRLLKPEGDRQFQHYPHWAGNL